MGTRCPACGRFLGLRTALECHCWRSMSREAVVPIRLRGLAKRIAAFDRMTDEAAKAIVAANLNVSLGAL